MVKHGHEASKRNVLRRNGVGLAEGELLFPGQHFSQYHLRDLLYRSQWWSCSGSELSLVDLSAGSLHVAGASPGVFVYGSGTLYPTDTWLSTNYWLDVVFSPATVQTSFWPDSATPDVPQVTNTSPVTLGLKFYSDVPDPSRAFGFIKELATRERMWALCGQARARS